MRVRTLKKNKVNIVTLGCSKNLVDSEVLYSQLQANKIASTHESEKNDSNIVVINTCGFIDKAKQESIDTILHFADKKEAGEIDKLFVTGCLSQRYKDDLKAEIPNVDEWFGTLELPNLLRSLGADYKKELLGERQTITPRHYAYLKISEGCNRPCSFCAIPLMRGNHVSKSIEDIVQESKNLVKNGVKEIMLIAQDTTYYGLDIYNERKLGPLMESLANVEGLEWIRLHYAYPSQFPMDVLDMIKKYPNICNYIDMPLQHITDNMLKTMRRGIGKRRTIELVDSIRQRVPDIALRTTMLVGHPGETEQDYEELLRFIEDTKFERLGVFTYSHEENTHAHNLENNIPEEIKQDRAERLMHVQQDVSLELNKQKIGKEFKILVDRVEGNNFVGRTEYDSVEVDNEVLVDNSHYLRVGDFAQVKITDATDFDLIAIPIK